jgi:hypothetical protein
MKKIYTVVCAVCVICAACVPVQHETASPNLSAYDITLQDQTTLKNLNAAQEGDVYTYKNSELILGNSHAAKQKQILLIHNRSLSPIVLDFPKGHIGGSAGLMHMIQPGEWSAYLYVKNKDYRPVESDTGERSYMRSRWTCRKGDPDYTQYKTCQDYLDIYSMDYDMKQLQTSHYSLDYKVLQIITQYNRARWLNHISSPSVKTLLMNHVKVTDH